MQSTPFVIERRYAASAEKVWQAITDTEKMKAWYFDMKGFKPEPGVRFSFTGGDDQVQYVHLCEVKEVIPGEKLSYTWKYQDFPGESLVTFELFPEGDHTRLKLTHAGLETFPQDKPDFARQSFEAGWTEIIGTSLKQFVEAA